MNLHQDRVHLRRLTADDVNFVLAITQDPEWLHFIGDRGIDNAQRATQYIDTASSSFTKQGYGLWLVESHCVAGDSRIGLCGFIHRSFLTTPDLGYAFLPHGRGKGLAREAVKKVMRWGKEHLNTRTVSAMCRIDNTRSIKVLEANQFVKVGRYFSENEPENALFLHNF